MAEGPELRGEDKLNHLFANKVMHSFEFRNWLLARTKFACLGTDVRMLDEVEYMIGPGGFGGDIGGAPEYPAAVKKETDIFLVFEDTQGNRKFSLHIENKLRNGKFTHLQAECYSAREST